MLHNWAYQKGHACAELDRHRDVGSNLALAAQGLRKVLGELMDVLLAINGAVALVRRHLQGSRLRIQVHRGKDLSPVSRERHGTRQRNDVTYRLLDLRLPIGQDPSSMSHKDCPFLFILLAQVFW